MSPIPAFQVGLWNAWLLMVPFLLVSYGLSVLVVDRKAALFLSPEYTDTEKQVTQISTLLLLLSVLYSIFLPLKLGTAWFFVGLAVYLVGMLLQVWATFDFASTSAEEPVTKGIFRFSRNPMYLAGVLVYLGTGLAAASWLFLVLGLATCVLQNFFWIPPEERMCVERFGESYQSYMDRTPKWLGLPKR